MDYSKVYKNIKPKAVLLSKQTAPRLWKEPLTHRKMYAIKWLINMSKIYNINCPKFEFNKDKDGSQRAKTGGGKYIYKDHKIVLYGKYSFVTLAHEFRHALQNKTNIEMYKGDPEEDARAWSLSLFRKSCPRAYKKAKQRDAFKHLS